VEATISEGTTIDILEDSDYEPVVSEATKARVYFITHWVSVVVTFLVSLAMVIPQVGLSGQVGGAILGVVTAALTSIAGIYRISSKK